MTRDETSDVPAPSGPVVGDVIADRLIGFGTTIFSEMTALAVETKSINLGQGFPDDNPPQEVADAAIAAIVGGHNQYPHGWGIAPLRGAIAEHQHRFYGLDVDPATEVLVTTGATEAISATMLSLINPGDEVVMFEPYYDSYAAAVALAGGVRRPVPLCAPDWTFNLAELEAAFSPRTKIILVNTPHNPTGRVFTLAEMQAIAEVALRHDVLVVTDEVYEHLAYDRDHLSMAKIDGMADRTISISSGGKTFSCTGWKIGWMTGPTHLLAAVQGSKQFVTYVSGGPLQYGIAAGLALPDEFFADKRAEHREKRDLFARGLTSAGLDPFHAEGGYFLTTDCSTTGLGEDAMDFCRRMAHQHGVVAIPATGFFDDRDRGR